MMDRNKLLDALENVHDFLKEIDDPGHKAVAMAAAYIAGELEWHPAARLLTLGEIRGWKDILWIELKGKAPEIAVVEDFPFDEGAMRIYKGRDLVMPWAVDYGRTFRCWASKPTAEDVAAAAWEVDGDA